MAPGEGGREGGRERGRERGNEGGREEMREGGEGGKEGGRERDREALGSISYRIELTITCILGQVWILGQDIRTNQHGSLRHV